MSGRFRLRDRVDRHVGDRHHRSRGCRAVNREIGRRFQQAGCRRPVGRSRAAAIPRRLIARSTWHRCPRPEQQAAPAATSAFRRSSASGGRVRSVMRAGEVFEKRGREVQKDRVVAQTGAWLPARSGIRSDAPNEPPPAPVSKNRSTKPATGGTRGESHRRPHSTIACVHRAMPCKTHRDSAIRTCFRRAL